MQAGLNKCGKIISANNTKIFMGMLTKLAALERTAKQLSEEVAELKKERNQTNFPALPEAAKEKPSSQKDHRKE